MKNKLSPEFFSAFFGILVGVFSVACSSTSDRWTGSVDAVFRYRPQENTTIVFEVRPESLSEEAGLKPGDLLLAVDGDDISNASYEAVRAVLRGPVGTKARITIKRGDKILDIEIERRTVKDNKSTENKE
ncbi:MAG: PDZ domain-containing protein [Proteobacteria bacterium]|nr:PDZ domain-containing protein [Pseudomonadota bacterium]